MRIENQRLLYDVHHEGTQFPTLHFNMIKIENHTNIQINGLYPLELAIVSYWKRISQDFDRPLCIFHNKFNRLVKHINDRI